MKTNLNLKDILLAKAEEWLKKVEDNGSLKGKSVNAKVAAIIFIASRQVNQPKSIKSILDATQATQKELSSCYKKIKGIDPNVKVLQL